MLLLVKERVNLDELNEVATELVKNGIEILGDLTPEINEFVAELKAFGLVKLDGNEVVLKMNKIPVELLDELHPKIEVIEDLLKRKAYISTTN